MELKSLFTRFRAYQLGMEGSSFSYYNGNRFTLIEARFTEKNKNNIKKELEILNKKRIDTLHITSWDDDHCAPNELSELLYDLYPSKIEVPGYAPHTDCGKESVKIIQTYIGAIPNITANVISNEYISALESGSSDTYADILYHPTKLFEKSNDNSTVQLFRSGSFVVASLGDVESPEIAKTLMNSKIFCEDTDIMILAHHGADNGFTTDEFIRKVKPKIAISCSNYDNQYEHPKQEIRDILYNNGVKLLTTKTGDVIIQSVESHSNKYQYYNYISDNQDLSSAGTFTTKRNDREYRKRYPLPV